MRADNHKMDVRTVWFTVTTLALAGAFWKTLAGLLCLALTLDEYVHILLVLPLTLSLLYVDRLIVFRHVRAAIYEGLAMAMLGAFLVSVARPSSPYQLCLLAASWVTLSLGMFTCFYGRRTFQAAIFPLLFLFLLVPLPKPALNGVIFVLQKGSAEVAYQLLQMVNVPVIRTGFVLSLPDINIEVAAECSGIRSSMLLFATGLVMAHIFLQSNWKKGIVGLSVLPITILKNGVRIFTLSMLAVKWDTGILAGPLHRRGGPIFFLLGLGMVASVIWGLRKLDSTPMTGPSPAISSTSTA